MRRFIVIPGNSLGIYFKISDIKCFSPKIKEVHVDHTEYVNAMQKSQDYNSKYMYPTPSKYLVNTPVNKTDICFDPVFSTKNIRTIDIPFQDFLSYMHQYEINGSVTPKPEHEKFFA